jgi:predicted amidohydrolase YtcJ
MAFEIAKFRIDRGLSELATEQQTAKQLQDFFEDAARLGITTVQDMASPISAQRSVSLFEKIPPPIRVRVIWFGLTDEHGRLAQEGRGLPRHPAP